MSLEAEDCKDFKVGNTESVILGPLKKAYQALIIKRTLDIGVKVPENTTCVALEKFGDPTNFYGQRFEPQSGICGACVKKVYVEAIKRRTTPKRRHFTNPNR